MKLQKMSSDYWKVTVRLTISRNLRPMFEYFLCKASLKKSKFTTHEFCSFWKPISSRILHSKRQILHQLLSFTGTLIALSQLFLAWYPFCAKSHDNEDKRNQWRQQRFQYFHGNNKKWEQYKHFEPWRGEIIREETNLCYSYRDKTGFLWIRYSRQKYKWQTLPLLPNWCWHQQSASHPKLPNRHFWSVPPRREGWKVAWKHKPV